MKQIFYTIHFPNPNNLQSNYKNENYQLDHDVYLLISFLELLTRSKHISYRPILGPTWSCKIFVLTICSDTNVNILGPWLVIFHWMNRENLQRSFFFVALLGVPACTGIWERQTSYEVKVLCNHQRNNTYLLHNYFTQWLRYSLFFWLFFCHSSIYISVSSVVEI